MVHWFYILGCLHVSQNALLISWVILRASTPWSSLAVQSLSNRPGLASVLNLLADLYYRRKLDICSSECSLLPVALTLTAWLGRLIKSVKWNKWGECPPPSIPVQRVYQGVTLCIRFRCGKHCRAVNNFQGNALRLDWLQALCKWALMAFISHSCHLRSNRVFCHF